MLIQFKCDEIEAGLRGDKMHKGIGDLQMISAACWLIAAILPIWSVERIPMLAELNA